MLLLLTVWGAGTRVGFLFVLRAVWQHLAVPFAMHNRRCVWVCVYVCVRVCVCTCVYVCVRVCVYV